MSQGASDDGSKNLFGTNQRFRAAVSQINDLPDDKFPLLLIRIIRKLDLKNERPFTEEEEEQLQKVLKLNSTELHSVLDSCTFIFEQSAYFGLSTEVLASQLEKAGVSTTKISGFEQVWKAEARELVGKLRKKTLTPYELDTIGWRLHLQMGQSSLSRLKEPAAIFNLGLKGSSSNEKDNVTIEFTHQELYDFFNKLEIIQEQLDNLG